MGLLCWELKLFRKKVQDKVHFKEKAKEPMQRSLPAKVGQSPGEVISLACKAFSGLFNIKLYSETTLEFLTVVSPVGGATPT